MAETGTQLNALPLSKRRLSAWGPLREPLFRSLWIAAVASYTGTWMQNVGTGWLMAFLTSSPVMVGLVQAASALPVFLVVIPAGALADMVDRRRLLILTQSWMVVAAAALGVLTILQVVTPSLLLLFTFLLGLGAATNDPPWQAITHEMVSEENFPAAVALNSAGFNVARAVGPALGGLIIAAWGSGIAFLVNAASFFGVIWVLYCWKRIPHEDPMPAKDVAAAIRTGFQYARQSAAMQSVLIRTGVFSLSATALWAMLPLIAKPYGSIGYGTLLAFFGVGALAGAAMLPWFRRALSVHSLVALATVLYAGVTYASGLLGAFWLLCLVLFAGGVGWIVILASLNVSAQILSPVWLRARTLSIYLLVLQGGMAAGSAFWGAVAGRFGIANALSAAAVALIVGLLASRNHRLRAEQADFSVSSVAES
ncbi:MAG TPA: MFS transporter [Terriglobales bacterium]|nr:MFS transporter [Terriglobales bacterium]